MTPLIQTSQRARGDGRSVRSDTGGSVDSGPTPEPLPRARLSTATGLHNGGGVRDQAQTASPLTSRLEEPLRLLLDELPLGVVHLDEAGSSMQYNAAALSILEGPAGPDLERALAEMYSRARTVDEPVEIALSLGPLGEIRVLLASCLGGYLAVLEHNAVARVRAENQVMRALLAAATEAAAPEVAAHRALSTLGSALPGSSLVLYEYAPASDSLSCLAHVGVPASHAAILAPVRVDERSSLVGRVMATRQPLHLPNLARAFFPLERSLPGGDKLSAVALPVSADEGVLGVLYVSGPRGLQTQGEVKLVQGVADALGALIRHGRRDEKLKRQRLAMTSLVENLPDAIFDRADDGTIALAEGRVAGLLGRAPAELVGRPLDALLAPEDRSKFEQVVLTATPHGHSVGEFAVTGRDGTPVWCEVTAWVAPSIGGGMVTRTLFRDISARRRLEADFAAARSMAIQRDRLAMIGQLAAGVAHEINNPLSYVKSNVSMIKVMLKDVVDVVEKILGPAVPESSERRAAAMLMADIEQIATESLSGVNRIASIVQSLKGMARTRPGEKVGFDPGPAVQQATQFFIGGKHCKDLVELKVPTLPMVLGESGGLSQVVLNLLDNAYDVLNGTGHITVSGEVKGPRVVIEVRDDGPGIPPEVQSHIFEPFFTTKGAGKGTGLGLHISHEIVRSFGGVLRFETGAGGTAFIIELITRTEEDPPHG